MHSWLSGDSTVTRHWNEGARVVDRVREAGGGRGNGRGREIRGGWGWVEGCSGGDLSVLDDPSV